MTKKKDIKKTTTKNSARPAKNQPDGDASTDSKSPFPIVGIGASAGGLAAYEAFFSGMPAKVDPGMAFVLVQHLAPDHKSILNELIQRYTRMQVFEVEDGMKVDPNCCYIIPPNHDMAFLSGRLQLMPPVAPRGQRLPIDFFFRSLAQDQCGRAIGIVLSGTGSDGTLGVRAIKGEGGMVMAQTLESADFDGMPSSVIATGLVDYELPPSEMPAQLMDYVSRFLGKRPRTVPVSTATAQSSLQKVFVLLRTQTGHDFSHYKPSTIHRRVERRMAIHQIETMSAYVQFLQRTPTEIEALFRDLLIGVTNFFRDPEAFKALQEQVIPRLFSGKSPGAMIRAWTPGCSTGEEAYSIAILLQERLESMKQGFKAQIFATDIDSQAIAVARTGRYPASIAADISPERLARFFTPESDGTVYRIHKSIRDMLIFSEQNVIKDPPFSRIDLLTCRNLLIYMDSDLQKKLFPLFHYSLNHEGFLFLGGSETVGEHHGLFETVDLKAKLFQRKDDVLGAQRMALSHFLPPMMGNENDPPGLAGKGGKASMPLRELTEQALLHQVVPVGALVNGQGEILYLHGRTGQYLEPAPGEAGPSNILKMARQGLRRDLSMALHKAVNSRKPVRFHKLRVKTNGDYTTADLTVVPVAVGSEKSTEPPLYLVSFEDVSVFDHEQGSSGTDAAAGKGSENAGSDRPGQESDAVLEELRQELRSKEEYLQSVIEEMDTSNEELKSSNEEMQSMNEELQSSNEELETSKEELQSVNEELSTVNAELQTKVADLSQANDDMNNLLAGTGIGTIFVDLRLCILRFTPAATKIVNLIRTDIGRPVGHVVSNLLDYNSLAEDIQKVLDNLIPKEIEARSKAGKWYKVNIQPYRTLENVIKGAVVTFVDITELVQAREALKDANEQLRLAVVVRDSSDAIAMVDIDGRILSWNPSAQRMYGWSEAEALSMTIADIVPEELREKALESIRQVVKENTQMTCETRRVAKDGRIVKVSMIATALLDEDGNAYAASTTERMVNKE